MTHVSQNAIVQKITEHYLRSSDFNGYPIRGMGSVGQLLVPLALILRLVGAERLLGTGSGSFGLRSKSSTSVPWPATPLSPIHFLPLLRNATQPDRASNR